MAPEIMEQTSYNYKSDIWSLGVLYYRMLFGEYPFKGRSLQQIKEEPYNGLQASNKCNKDSADFIRRCLRYKTADRIDWP